MQAKVRALQGIGEATEPGASWDALVVVSHAMPPRLPDGMAEEVAAWLEVDAQAQDEATLIRSASAPGGRLVLAPTGPLEREIDDVRRVADAARAGIRRALAAGSRRPVLLVRGMGTDPRFAHARAVAALAALGEGWAPLEAREVLGDNEAEAMAALGLVVPEDDDAAELVSVVEAVEAGRRLARDLAGTEPERMAPARFAAHCEQAFADTPVEVEVVEDEALLRADYPLLHAVARASLAVPRHHPRVVRLVYEGEGPVHETLLLAGKGVTYDTGGADLKTGGHMAGMSRDKGGAAGVAGFVRAVAALAPKGLRVVAELGLVRNSVGADSFVTDEILVSHAGVRVRVGNTDAEGRLVMADLLSHLRVEAGSSVGPRLFSVATLTGHAVIAVGPYTIALDNGPARRLGHAADLAAAGEVWGEPVEISRLRREDVDFVRPRTRADDVLSSNNAPSSATPRGHQFPAAFLMAASGLDRHGLDAEDPLPYTHLDIAGSALEGMDWQHGRPTGAPVAMLMGRFVL